MHEGDQRQRLGGGVIDRDVVGRAEVLQDDDVGVGEQKIEALAMKIGSDTESQVLA